jgi:hypothetical protein
LFYLVANVYALCFSALRVVFPVTPCGWFVADIMSTLHVHNVAPSPSLTSAGRKTKTKKQKQIRP